MAEAAQRARWDHTSVLTATLINLNRDPKKGSPVSAEELNPYRQKRTTAAPGTAIKLDKKQSMAALKAVFIDHRMPDGLQKG